jgi:SET domain-containing protein
MLYFSKKIKVDYSPIQGRGVFATDTIKKDEVIEECHFIKLEEGDFSKLDKSIKEISFTWPLFANNSHAIVLGFGSIYNHNMENNATWETDTEKMCYRFIAINDIEPGQEICINYMKVINF